MVFKKYLGHESQERLRNCALVKKIKEVLQLHVRVILNWIPSDACNWHDCQNLSGGQWLFPDLVDILWSWDFQVA